MSEEDIKRREMELLHACIAVFVRDMNKNSSFGGEVDVLCPDGLVYPILAIMMSIAMDHKATEQHCHKAACRATVPWNSLMTVAIGIERQCWWRV